VPYMTYVLAWIQFSHSLVLGHEVNFRPTDYSLFYINHCSWHNVSLLLFFVRKNKRGRRYLRFCFISDNQQNPAIIWITLLRKEKLFWNV